MGEIGVVNLVFYATELTKQFLPAELSSEPGVKISDLTLKQDVIKIVYLGAEPISIIVFPCKLQKFQSSSCL